MNHLSRTRQFSRASSLLLALFLVGCAAKSNIQVEPVTDPGRRYAVAGVTVLPPTGRDWSAVTKPGANVIYFFKGKPGEHTTTAYVMVLMRTLEGRQFATAQQLMEWLRERERRMEPGVRMVKDDYAVERASPPWRIRFRETQEDTRVPGHEGKPFVTDAAGYWARHPQWPDYVVTVAYSRRAPKGQSPLPIEAEARATLASLQFTGEEPSLPGYTGRRAPAQAGTQ